MLKITVAEKLRLITRRQNMSIADLAAATHQSKQNLSNKLSRGNFSELDIDRYAEALGCTVDITFTLPDGTPI